MRALTLTQPWASLVAGGAKRIETRSWKTRYRGPLAIHAAKGLGGLPDEQTERGLAELCHSEPFESALAEIIRPTFATGELPRGAFVAVAELVDIVPTARINFAMTVVGIDLPEEIERERAFGNYAVGRFAWILDRVRPLSAPLPFSGSLGLRRLDDELSARLRALETDARVGAVS